MVSTIDTNGRAIPTIEDGDLAASGLYAVFSWPSLFEPIIAWCRTGRKTPEEMRIKAEATFCPHCVDLLADGWLTEPEASSVLGAVRHLYPDGAHVISPIEDEVALEYLHLLLPEANPVPYRDLTSDPDWTHSFGVMGFLLGKE